jgi:hypothetical protein
MQGLPAEMVWEARYAIVCQPVYHCIASHFAALRSLLAASSVHAWEEQELERCVQPLQAGSAVHAHGTCVCTGHPPWLSAYQRYGSSRVACWRATPWWTVMRSCLSAPAKARRSAAWPSNAALLPAAPSWLTGCTGGCGPLACCSRQGRTHAAGAPTDCHCPSSHSWGGTGTPWTTAASVWGIAQQGQQRRQGVDEAVGAHALVPTAVCALLCVPTPLPAHAQVCIPT